MARLDKYTITEGTLIDIGDAIRSKTGGTADIDPVDMPQEILDIPSGGDPLDSIILVDSSTLDAVSPPSEIRIESTATGKIVKNQAFAYYHAENTPLAVKTKESIATILANSAFKSIALETDNSIRCSGGPVFVNGGPLRMTARTLQLWAGALVNTGQATMYIILDAEQIEMQALNTARKTDSPTPSFVICILNRKNTVTGIDANAFREYSSSSTVYSAEQIRDIYVAWSEGAVANAPWGATNAVIHYDTTFDADGYPVT